MTFLERVLLVFISVALAWIVNVLTNLFFSGRQEHRDTRKAIRDRTDKLIDLSIQYPYFEDDGFIAKFADGELDQQSEEVLRYESYCCFVFNLIEQLFIHSDGNTDEMHSILSFQELAYRHRHWWKIDDENEVGYSEPFTAFIDKQILEASNRLNGSCVQTKV